MLQYKLILVLDAALGYGLSKSQTMLVINVPLPVYDLLQMSYFICVNERMLELEQM